MIKIMKAIAHTLDTHSSPPYLEALRRVQNIHNYITENGENATIENRKKYPKKVDKDKYGYNIKSNLEASVKKPPSRTKIILGLLN